MSQGAERHRMSVAEYLAFEREAREKHQYVRGEVFAMAGASVRHNRIVARLIFQLGRGLGDGPCQVFASDLKVHVASLDTFTYPDLSIFCGPPALYEGSTDVVTNPKVLFEVLSEPTERYDRVEKAEGYRAIPSLDDHLFVDQKKAHVEHYARRPDDAWTLREAGPGGTITIASVGVTLDVDAIYAGVFALPA